MKSFNIPEFYRSSIITGVKRMRNASDRMKKDLKPVVLDFGPVSFYLARHFGFCYGVENAIEISYRALDENPGKRIFLLSQMIHNPLVNQDLQERGIRFIMDTRGNQLISWDDLTPDDVMIVPAFGTTLEIENELASRNILIENYNTTCPFVEKVWKRSSKLGGDGYTVIIHGKHRHEETRATFSHAGHDGPAVVIRDMKEASFLVDVILGKRTSEAFHEKFKGRITSGFDVSKDLLKVGVVNQTTMLAEETQAIADYVKKCMLLKYPDNPVSDHYADTRDTLCYATNDNQQATYALLKEKGDLAIVVGGFNSSNTSHIVELCEEKMPTYFIRSETDILSSKAIHHFNYKAKQELDTKDYLPQKSKIKVFLTSGASCPDAIVERVMLKIAGYFPEAKSAEEVFEAFSESHNKATGIELNK